MSRSVRASLLALLIALAAAVGAATPAQAAPRLCFDPPVIGTGLDVGKTLRAETLNGGTSVKLSWDLPYGCWEVPASWRVLVDGQEYATVTGDATQTADFSIVVTGLEPTRRYDVTVEPLGGNAGQAPVLVARVGFPEPPLPCTLSGVTVSAGDISSFSAAFSWTIDASCEAAVARYEIALDGTVLGTRAATDPKTATIDNLRDGTTYRITVTALLKNGTRGLPSPGATITTIDIPDETGTARLPVSGPASGAAVLRTASPGTLTLGGRLDLLVPTIPGTVSGRWDLAPSRLTFRVANLFTVVATATFGGDPRVAGTYDPFYARQLNVQTSRTIAFRNAKVLGFDILGGKVCTTPKPVKISVTTKPDPVLTAPFALAGTIEPFGLGSACGFFGSQLVQKGLQNVVNVNVTPEPVPTPTPNPSPTPQPTPTIRPLPSPTPTPLPAS